MKCEMEILSQTPYFSSSDWLLGERRNTKWTHEENKIFENALALYDEDTSDRWHKVAAMIPGKTPVDVMRQYEELEVDVGKIEAGLVPIRYNTSPFTLDWVNNNHGFDGFKNSYVTAGKRSPANRPSDQERKKGVPWTEEEHKSFLMGLKKYGKGDWRNISRNFVITRTPTQVASHAQKYFIRQLSGGKDKRRASIHDINLTDTRTPSPDNNQTPSPENSPVVVQHKAGSATMPPTHFQWNQPSESMGFNSGHANMFMSNTYNGAMQNQNLQRRSIHESYFGNHGMGFQIEATMNYRR